MRQSFLTAALTAVALLIPVTQADANETRQRTKSTQKASKKLADKPVNSIVGDCTPEKREGRVRADVLFDMRDGAVVSSTLFDVQSGNVVKTNLSADDLKKTVIHPASLTKLESVMELMRRIMAGDWAKDTVVKFFFKKKQPTNLTLTDVAIASLNPSANVMDHPQIATPEFIESMNAYMKSKGMDDTTYLNATGYPTDQKVRKGHLTTLRDLIIGIRDFELNYATPEKVRQVFGIEKLTGLWKIDVPGLKRQQHTITVLESAEGKGARPIEGVVSGKSGTTCNFGSGAYLTYQFNQKYTFGLLTIGHESGARRDVYIEDNMATQRQLMAEFVRKAEATPPAPAATPAAAAPSTPREASGTITALAPPLH